MIVRLRHACLTGVLLANTTAYAGEPSSLVPAKLTESADVAFCAAGPRVGVSPLRRLTRFEYNNTVSDLLGERVAGLQSFPEEGGSGFDNNADLSIAARIHAQKYLSAAERIAAKATADLPKLLGCKPDGKRELPCIRRWLKTFGERAWRRPLSRAEFKTFDDLYHNLRKEDDPTTSVRLILTALLEAPRFLYRIEESQPAAAHELVALDDYEVATRLSYFLWGTTPDTILLQKARQGRLHRPDDILKQARRLMKDVRVKIVVRRFFDQWSGVTLLERLQKEQKKPQTWKTLAIAPLLRQQFDRFIDHVMWESDGTIATLLTTPVTFVNKALGDYLHMETTAEGDAFVQTSKDGDKRAGILSLAGFLAMQAKVNETSPIKRGMFVREQLLCQIPPPPPPNLMMTDLPPPNGDVQTVRERLEDHRLDMGCNKCHKLFDPLGLAFENFDTYGAWRDKEMNSPIDASGAIVASDVDGDFNNLPEMAARLARSQQVADCMVRQWFRFALGRTESKADQCALAELSRRFTRDGHRIPKLLEAIVTSEAFLYRAADRTQMAAVEVAR